MALTNSTPPSLQSLLPARKPAHHDGYQIARHLLTQDIGFMLLRQQYVFFEAVILGEADGLRREQLLIDAVYRESDRVRELVFRRDIGRRHRQRSLLDQIL